MMSSVAFSTINLDVIREFCAVQISGYELVAARKPEIIVERNLDGLLIRLETLLAGHQASMEVSHEAQWPATWWDHFKYEVVRPKRAGRTWLARWWVRVRERWLARHRVEWHRDEFRQTVHAKALFPDIEIQRGHRVVYVVQGEERGIRGWL